MPILSGANVSKYQNKIQWDALAPQLDFVFIRATGGESYVDPYFVYNRAEAARNGLVRGYYHVARPEQDPLAQASHFSRTVGDLAPGELDLVLALEWTQHRKDRSHRWTSEDTAYLQAWTRSFVRVIQEEHPDRSVILYTRHNFWLQHLGGTEEFGDCSLWIAHHTHGTDSLLARPPADPKQWQEWAFKMPLQQWSPWQAWTFWQFTAKAVLPGITGNTVDANLFNGTLDELRRLARIEVLALSPKPLRTADDLCKILLAQQGDRYEIGHEVRLTEPNPSVFDCSELIEWACSQLGVKPQVPDGSWMQVRHVKEAGLLMPVETAIATRGALLFRFSADPFTGARPKRAHVALSLGDGHTIEARDTARGGGGVFPALDRGWTHAGRLPGIDYSAVPKGGAITVGAKGPEVKAWQRDLLRWRPGILPKYGADGDFGKETLAATKLFQKEMALPMTGVVGPETREAMQRALPRPLCALEVPLTLSRALLGVVEARRAAERAASCSPSGGAPRDAGGDGLKVVNAQSAEGEVAGVSSFTFTANGFQVAVTVTPVDGPAEIEPGTDRAPLAPSDIELAVTPQFDGRGLEGLPARDANAMTGTQFYDKARSLPLAAWEELFFQEVLRGNVPSFLRRFSPVTVASLGGRHGVIYVCPDYLAIGSDDDYLRMPLTGVTAQRVADACGCVLPTKKLVGDIYAASRKQTAITIIPVGANLEQYRKHHRAVEQRRVGDPGELLAGHKKDIVVTNRLHYYSRRLAIYGFFKADGKPWQPLDTSLKLRLPHEDTYADYSHGVRLIGGLMALGPEQRCVADVLLDPVVCGLVSEEGIISVPRYEVHPIG
jgi:GH25 family lysozyme M1 (1,4-beta-N-acetylmuramidase)/cell wall-associated NlpC family hydrolase